MSANRPNIGSTGYIYIYIYLFIYDVERPSFIGKWKIIKIIEKTNKKKQTTKKSQKKITKKTNKKQNNNNKKTVNKTETNKKQ